MIAHYFFLCTYFFVVHDQKQKYSNKIMCFQNELCRYLSKIFNSRDFEPYSAQILVLARSWFQFPTMIIGSADRNNYKSAKKTLIQALKLCKCGMDCLCYIPHNDQLLFLLVSIATFGWKIRFPNSWINLTIVFSTATVIAVRWEYRQTHKLFFFVIELSNYLIQGNSDFYPRARMQANIYEDHFVLVGEFTSW